MNYKLTQPKIILCVPKRSAYYLPIIKSLKFLGFKTKVFDFDKGNFPTNYFVFFNNIVFHRNKDIKTKLNHFIQHQLIKLSIDFKPNYLLVIKGHEIKASTIKTINNFGITTINWYPDWLTNWNWIKNNCVHYKYFFSICINLNEKIKPLNSCVYYLPSASDPNPNYHSGPKKYNISFIGSFSSRREKYFKSIADLGLRIWGYSIWSKSSLNKYTSPQVSANTVIKLIRKSKICVNILTGNDNFQPNALNNRIFESLGTGTFMLIKKYPLLDKYFEDGKDLVTFTSPSDLRKKAIYYLKHDKEREKIAKSGWEKVKKYHTYDIRLKELFNIINLNEKN